MTRSSLRTTSAFAAGSISAAAPVGVLFTLLYKTLRFVALALFFAQSLLLPKVMR